SETEWAYTVTNSRDFEETEVKVTKVWDDSNNEEGFRPGSVTVNLKKGDAVLESVELNSDNSWSYSWTKLQKYENGVAVNYTVTEDPVANYSTQITKATDGSFTYTVKNSRTVEKTQVSVEKIWDDADNQDGYRPDDVTIELFANGEKAGEVALNAGNEWKHTWLDLNKFAKGEEIEYTVKEPQIEKYEEPVVSKISATEWAYTVTNSHKTEETEAKVKKVWDDADDQDGYRTADVTINLLADGEVIDTVKLSKDNNWSYEWTKLDKKAAGKDIDYTVTENAVSEYETEIVKASDAVIGGVVDGTSDGIVTNQYNNGEVTEGTDDGTFSYIITNSHTPETISPIVKVVWVDEDNRNGKRPESVDSVLVNDEEESKGTVTLGLETEWTETAKEPVAKYKNGGTPVKYTWTITSELPAGYEVVDTAEDGLTTTITIAYIAKPVKLPLEVVKVLTGREWNEKDAFEFTLAADAENPEGAELPEVTVVNATAETKTVAFDEIVFSKRGTYKFTITETKGTLDGVSYDTVAKEFVVVVEDDGVGSLYIDEVTNKGSVEITNVYSSVGAIQFAAKKVLDGRELKDGEFTFVLKNEAGEVLQTATCDKDGKISFEPIAYTEKDMVVDGKIVATREYTYTISEVKPEGEKYDALIVYDESVKTIKVTLTDNQDGTITADAKTTDANITFTNVKLAEYEITFVDEDGTTVLKAARKYVVGTKAADVEKPADPTKKEDDSFTYEFSGWTPEISDVAGDVTYKATYKATAKPGVYYLVGDAPSAKKGEGAGLVMQFKRTVKDEITFDQFDGISFNGKVLSKDLYKAVKGSVIITVPQEFINSLPDGKNEVIVTFKDGDPVKVSVEILPAQSSEDDPVDPNKTEEEKKVSPKTADTMVYGWMIVLLGISGVTVLLVIRRRREEEEQIGM
ncbi:MAG: Cna B-type domain-containing protein, partial [Lachnospiraceae bacterium]|nr:Cna B-type domain-containing protein [Lachnospiraceae bacterium]